MLVEVAARYDIEADPLRLLTNNPDNVVYCFVRQGQKFVLKCTPAAAHRNIPLDRQVAWINFLAEQGAAVCRAIPSPHGHLIEHIQVAGQTTWAVCYEYAAGERPAGTMLTAEFFQTWGRLMGQIHRLTIGYTAMSMRAPMRADRDHWTADNQALYAELLADQPGVRSRFEALLTWCRTLPSDASAFGLVHNDLQLNNVHLDRGDHVDRRASDARHTLTAFDFDNCEHNWFASDIATALYFTMWEQHPGHSNAGFAGWMLEHFLEGYARERPLEPFWIEQIPMFLKMQEMRVYLIISQQYRDTFKPEPDALQLKLRALLDRYRQNIEQGIPYIESAYNPWRSIAES